MCEATPTTTRRSGLSRLMAHRSQHRRDRQTRKVQQLVDRADHSLAKSPAPLPATSSRTSSFISDEAELPARRGAKRRRSSWFSLMRLPFAGCATCRTAEPTNPIEDLMSDWWQEQRITALLSTTMPPQEPSPKHLADRPAPPALSRSRGSFDLQLAALNLTIPMHTPDSTDTDMVAEPAVQPHSDEARLAAEPPAEMVPNATNTPVSPVSSSSVPRRRRCSSETPSLCKIVEEPCEINTAALPAASSAPPYLHSTSLNQLATARFSLHEKIQRWVSDPDLGTVRSGPGASSEVPIMPTHDDDHLSPRGPTSTTSMQQPPIMPTAASPDTTASAPPALATAPKDMPAPAASKAPGASADEEKRQRELLEQREREMLEQARQEKEAREAEEKRQQESQAKKDELTVRIFTPAIAMSLDHSICVSQTTFAISHRDVDVFAR
ncbi:uncharacterized protein MONBRDRAFT_39066 [Monosiga brevicollis MX1]|uniref:Uncharacterized protein n=1 Tax=Monosiga brevicollis TaxID=81824 RepID=A9VC05_MONBE|nr:uncharacterized protein MONBRDRAFT_39066 [Monosiga brevicollis MX1]EDQ84896.1 predicted protein [Monosiga brevicollis MX1]|eukprot:XP_001750237.1 hypothetical protein [Monosiga brevicollis MX1]